MKNSAKSLEERVSDLERDVTSTLVSLRSLISSLPDKEESAPLKTFLEKFLVPLIPGLILFLIGYFLIDSVRQDLNERQLQTTNAVQIKPLLDSLLGRELPKSEEADASALALAGFGRYSVVPLLNVLEAGGESRLSAAKKGLIAAGHIEPRYACRVLISALDDRTQLYSWHSHKELIEIIGRLKCPSATEAFNRYESLLSLKPDAFRKSVNTQDIQDNDLPNKIKDLSDLLQAARSRLN